MRIGENIIKKNLKEILIKKKKKKKKINIKKKKKKNEINQWIYIFKNFWRTEVYKK